jgi:hypothetical protein
MNCEFCNKTFSSKSNLTAHQTTAKFCLEIQGKHKEEKQFKCEYCDKLLTQRSSLEDHYNICKEKLKKCHLEKDREYSNIIRKLELELVKMKKSDEKNKKLIDEKDSCYQAEQKEKENLILQLKQKDTYHEAMIKEKNEYIAKLEAKLEKFEDAVVTNMAATTSKLYDENDEYNEEDDDVMIPLGKQIDSIIIKDKKEEEVEYSNITLNNIVITSRPIDHYVNATQLCQAGGKFFKDWFRLESTKELINELSADGRILPSLLVESNRGRTSKYTQGSWIHPDLSIQLAQWISPKFAIQVSKWIRTLFSEGSLQIDMNLLHQKDREMSIKDHRIKQLESVCLSKQRRVEYPERNVIYMLTTEDHRQRRTYIIGKAKNLTNRLSTYNKTCDHTVVYYRECKNEDDMDAAETMVLSKLRSHREQANRDRFIIPENKDESFFTKMIDDCVRFLE